MKRKYFYDLIYSPDESAWYYERFTYQGKDKPGIEHYSKQSFESKAAAKISFRSNSIDWIKR